MDGSLLLNVNGALPRPIFRLPLDQFQPTPMKVQSLGANKTQVDLADGTSVFFSYKTPVAALVPGKGWIRTSTRYSVTTTKHINQWIEAPATEVDQWTIDQLVAF